MIENEVQYNLSKQSVDGFREKAGVAAGKPRGAGWHIDPILARAEEDGLQSIIDELREDIQVYEAAKQGRKAPGNTGIAR